MQKTRLLLTFFLCSAAILMLVGCNILDNLVKDGGGKAPLSQILNRTPDNNEGADATPVITAPQQGESTVKLYFADNSGTRLIEVNRTIPKTLSLAKETVNQWLLGPVSGLADSYPAVSSETVLRGINIKNGIATVDLSKEFLEPFSNIAAETALYGLVNTVAQFTTVEIVKLRIEGQEINVFRGMDLSNLRFRSDLIGYSSGPAVQGKSLSEASPMPDSSLAAASGEEQSAVQEADALAAAVPAQDKVNETGAQDDSPSSINLFVH